MKKLVFGGVISATAIVSVASLLLFHSCGGGGNGGASSSQTGKVALYVTDGISGYQQVTLTIHKIQFVNSGTQAVCDVYTAPPPPAPPLTVDIANLSNVLQLVSIAECAPVPYNRIDIEIEKGNELLDNSGAASQCWFTSYLNAGSPPVALPNTLICDSVTNICVLQIRGAVRRGSLNVLSGQPNKLALDFNLQDFVVQNFGDPVNCSVTMKVTPLNAAEMMKSKHPEGITGRISNLDTASKTFTLTKGNNAFAVNYSGIVAAKQPGLDALMQKAVTDGLRVTVMSTSIDMSNNSIDASAVYAKVEGTVTGPPSVNTFTLTYQSTKTINVNYASPAVDGTLADTVWVEVKLDGYDVGTGFYHAAHVEVETQGTVTDD